MQGTHVTKENEEDIGWSGHLRKRGHMGQMGQMGHCNLTFNEQKAGRRLTFLIAGS